MDSAGFSTCHLGCSLIPSNRIAMQFKLMQFNTIQFQFNAIPKKSLTISLILGSSPANFNNLENYDILHNKASPMNGGQASYEEYIFINVRKAILLESQVKYKIHVEISRAAIFKNLGCVQPLRFLKWIGLTNSIQFNPIIIQFNPIQSNSIQFQFNPTLT